MRTQPRPMGRERARRAKRSRRRRWALARWLPDALALLLLGLVCAGLLLHTLRRPPEAFAFVADAPPDGVLLKEFYGPERNAAGGYRWSKPEAALILPVTAPAVYRVTLTVQDAPAAGPRGPVAVYIAGEERGRFAIDAAPREYRAEGRLDPVAWSADRLHALPVELQVAPFLPPGDPRPLGVIVTRVAVEPVAPLSPWQPAVLAPLLLLLVVAYGMLRGLGLAVGWVAGALGAGLAAFALLAFGARDEALALVHEAASQPLGLLAMVGWLAATPLIARAGVALTPAPHPPAPSPEIGRGGWELWWAVGLFVALRVAFSAGGALAAESLPVRPPCDGLEGEVSPALHATGAGFRFLGVWQHWDACWYEQIAAQGYRAGDPAVNFFPLYPGLMAAVAPLVGGNITLAGLIVSGAAYVAALAGIGRLVAADFGEAVARRTILALSVFPAAFTLFVPYTEALFLALGVWALALAREGRWGWAALPALLIGLTRTPGALLAAPLAWEAYRQWRDGGRRAPFAPRRLLTGLVVALPGVGLLLFLLYGKVVVGQTTLQTQSGRWGNIAQAPWVALAASVEHIRRRGDPTEALNLAIVLLWALALTAGLRRLPLLYTLYAVPQFLLIVTHQNPVSPLLGAARYALVIFPAFVALALVVRWRPLHYLWLAGSVALLVWLTYLYISGPLIA